MKMDSTSWFLPKRYPKKGGFNMLPQILDIAGKYDLKFDPKSYGKKESRCKCPFCLEDSHPDKRKKYYLSLNTEKQLYKCWFCKESGGVLHLEAKLSGKSFDQIKRKYFGKQRKNLHPAYRLNPEQLDKIGWREYKQKAFDDFVKKRDDVIHDWNAYLYEQYKLYYGLYVCITRLDFDREILSENLNWFIKKCWEEDIPDIFNAIQDEWINRSITHQRQPKTWAEEGELLARVAWNTCLRSGDFDYTNLFMNVLFANYLLNDQELLQKINHARVVGKNGQLAKIVG